MGNTLIEDAAPQPVWITVQHIVPVIACQVLSLCILLAIALIANRIAKGRQPRMWALPLAVFGSFILWPQFLVFYLHMKDPSVFSHAFIWITGFQNLLFEFTANFVVMPILFNSACLLALLLGGAAWFALKILELPKAWRIDYAFAAIILGGAWLLDFFDPPL